MARFWIVFSAINQYCVYYVYYKLYYKKPVVISSLRRYFDDKILEDGSYAYKEYFITYNCTFLYLIAVHILGFLYFLSYAIDHYLFFKKKFIFIIMLSQSMYYIHLFSLVILCFNIEMCFEFMHITKPWPNWSGINQPFWFNMTDYF